MRKLKRVLSIGVSLLILVSSVGFAQENVSGENTLSPSDTSVAGQNQASTPKIKSIRKIVFPDDRTKDGTSVEQKKSVEISIPLKPGDGEKNSVIEAKDIVVENGYIIEVYYDEEFKIKRNENNILIGEGNITGKLPAYLKIVDSKNQGFTQYISVTIKFYKDGEIHSILDAKPDIFGKSDATTPANRRKIGITLPNMNKIQLWTNDIKLENKKKSDDTKFYTDASYQERINRPIDLMKTVNTIYFTVEMDDTTLVYYELTVKNPYVQSPDVRNPDASANSGAGSSRSAVRPDSSPSSSKPESKVEPKKDETKKVDMKKDAKETGNKASEKVSTKLMIGQKNYTAYINGQPMTKTADIAPLIHQGRVMMPARMISEILGVDVQFDAANKTAHFMYGENKVELTLGQKQMRVNDVKIELTADILNQNGRILLPLRDIQRAFQSLGLETNIQWDSANKSLTVEK